MANNKIIRYIESNINYKFQNFLNKVYFKVEFLFFKKNLVNEEKINIFSSFHLI